MQRDLTAIRQRGRAGHYNRGFDQTGPPPEPEEEPKTPEERQAADGSFGDRALDLALAPVRGAESALRSTYGLLDAITLDSLPDYERNFTGESKYFAGQLLEGITQFGVGFYALGGALGAVGRGVKGAEFLLAGGEAAKGLSTAGNVARGVLTDFTIFDGQSGRLADLAAKIPGLEEPMNQYLSFALTNKDDGELVGRMKNALEGAGVGAAIDGIIHGIRWLKEVKVEQAAGKTVPEAVEAANKVVHLDDINKAVKQMDDMRFGPDSPFVHPGIDEALAKSREGPVFLNADGSEDLFTTESIGMAPGRPVHGIADVELKPGDRVTIDANRDELEAMLKKNLAHEASVATSVLSRELNFDEKAVDNYLDTLRRARDVNNPEHAKAVEQIDGIKARLSNRGRKKLDALPPSGRTTQDVMDVLRTTGSDRATRAVESLGGTEYGPRGFPNAFVSLAEMETDGGALSKWELQNWVNKFGTMLDNPQTTIKLENGKASIGVTLRPEQAKDDAIRTALEAFRCAGGV